MANPSADVSTSPENLVASHPTPPLDPLPIPGGFDVRDVPMLYAGHWQLLMAPLLRDEDVSDWAPDGTGLFAGMDEVPVIPENVKTTTRAADSNNRSVLVSNESNGVRLAFLRTPDEGKNNDVVLLALVTVNGADVVLPRGVNVAKNIVLA